MLSVSFSALILVAGWHDEHPALKTMCHVSNKEKNRRKTMKVQPANSGSYGKQPLTAIRCVCVKDVKQDNIREAPCVHRPSHHWNLGFLAYNHACLWKETCYQQTAETQYSDDCSEQMCLALHHSTISWRSTYAQTHEDRDNIQRKRENRRRAWNNMDWWQWPQQWQFG